MSRTQISSNIDAVVELPAGADPAPAVVIAHEWWGVNEQIQTVAKRWAAAGFVAIVPDLYGGKVAKDAAEASAMMKALDFGRAVGQIGECIAYGKAHARGNGRAVMTGYCMGGALTFATAVNVRGLAAAIPFYGLPGELDWSKVDAPIQAHFAKHDDWATVAGAEQIRAAVRVPMELHVYDAEHAFCNDRRPEVYNADAAKLAWDRAVAFANSHAR